MKAFFLSCNCHFATGSGHDIEAQILKVSSVFQSIAEAVENAMDGATIILSPGIYHEKSIEISKVLTISSEWILTGGAALIESTVIDTSDSILFSMISNDVEICGLKIINGNHPLVEFN